MIFCIHNITHCIWLYLPDISGHTVYRYKVDTLYKPCTYFSLLSISWYIIISWVTHSKVTVLSLLLKVEKKNGKYHNLTTIYSRKYNRLEIMIWLPTALNNFKSWLPNSKTSKADWLLREWCNTTIALRSKCVYNFCQLFWVFFFMDLSDKNGGSKATKSTLKEGAK